MTRSPLTAVQTLARAHRTRLAELLAPHGLHPGQDLLLLVLWDEPGLRQGELAARLDVEPPTVTRMVQRLERGGMVERRADRDDGRVTCVFPTPRSRLLESSVRRSWQLLDDLLVATIGAAAAADLQRIADEARAAFASES